MKKLLSALLACFIGVPVFAGSIGLNSQNSMVIRGEVSAGSMTRAQFHLMELIKKRGKKTYTIYITMDTPGGSVIAGETFIEMAKLYPNVETISMFAASMGSAIVQALPGKRWVLPSGILMFHRASGVFSGQFETGEVESQLKFFKQYIRRMEHRNAWRLGLELDAYKEKVKDEWWIHGYDAVREKVADEVAHVYCTQELIEKEVVVVSRSLFGNSVEIYSGCPLIRGPMPSVEER